MTFTSDRADVTVAIATVDRPESVVRSISAVLSGSRLPSEIVVVDQSAGTATREAIDGIARTSPVPVKYLHQSSLGLAASRNLAWRHATGRIVAFTDDDCVPDREWLAQLAGTFDGLERPHAVTGRILPLGPERPGFHAVSSRTSTRPWVYRGRALPWAVGSGGNTAVQREWLVRIGGFDEGFGVRSPRQAAEDTDMVYRLLREGATICYEPAALVWHERQSAARRLASRPSYGFGMGAFCAKWARAADLYAFWMFTCWVVERLCALASAAARMRPRRIREELTMLAGAARGIVFGFGFAPGERACRYGT